MTTIAVQGAGIAELADCLMDPGTSPGVRDKRPQAPP